MQSHPPTNSPGTEARHVGPGRPLRHRDDGGRDDALRLPLCGAAEAAQPGPRADTPAPAQRPDQRVGVLSKEGFVLERETMLGNGSVWMEKKHGARE